MSVTVAVSAVRAARCWRGAWLDSESSLASMGNSGSAFTRWDQLFQALTRPEDLRAYLEQMAPLEQG